MADVSADMAPDDLETNPTHTADDGLAKPGRKAVPPVTARMVEDRYQKAVHYQRKEAFDYQLARAMLEGDQWVYYDRVTNSLRQIPRDAGRVRATMNRIWPASRTVISKALSRPLTFEVPPGDSDDASIRGAHLAQSVLQHLWRDHNWETLREQASWASWLGGSAIIAVDWDAKAGTSIGMSPMTGNKIGTGDIVESVLTILEVAFEPGIRDAEKAVWWIRAQALPPGLVRDTYDLDYDPPTDVSGAMAPLQARMVQGDRRENAANLTRVLTYYERPNNSRPQGAVATLVGGRLVDGPKDWPFPFKDRLNLVLARETKVAGRWTGTSVVQAAIPVQVAYNAAWSNMLEHLKQAGNARLMIPEGTLDLMDELTDTPGEIMPINPASGEPKYLSPPQMPQWWVEEGPKLAQELDDILGVHDVSRGQAPKNIESGLGLSILSENDGTPLGHMVKEHSEVWSRFASLVLQIYADKVTEKRKAVLRPTGGVPETVTWSGKALENQTHAYVPLDAVMPRSRSAMLAFARELFDRQMIKDPAHFAQVADLDRQDQFLEALDPDMAKAKRENHLFTLGQEILPAEFDDDQIHIAAHNDFRKTVRYEAMTSQARRLVDQHLQAHETSAAEKQGKMLAKMNVHPALASAPNAQGAPMPPMPGPGGMLPPEAPPMVKGRNFAAPMTPIPPPTRALPGGPVREV
jgi:hypothetical protein